MKRWILLKNDVSRENVYRGGLQSNGGTHFGTVVITLSCKSPTRDEWEKEIDSFPLLYFKPKRMVDLFQKIVQKMD